MSNLTLWLLCFIVPMIIGFAIQGWLRNTFARNSQRPIATGKTGAEVAREILDRNGLTNVEIGVARGGSLSDHYDPRRRTVFLSQDVFSGRSIASTAVAAHESGHAIQHARHYLPMTARSLIFPLAALGSQAWFFLLLAGIVLQLTGLIYAALVIFAFAVLFQLVTLPVEFNASRRAAAQLQSYGLVTSEAEAEGVRKTLTAAAMTYVAGALASIAQLLYFLAIFTGSRD